MQIMAILRGSKIVISDQLAVISAGSTLITAS